MKISMFTMEIGIEKKRFGKEIWKNQCKQGNACNEVLVLRAESVPTVEKNNSE